MKKILFFLSIAAFSNNVFNLHAEEKDLNEKNSIEANISSFNDNEIINEKSPFGNKPLNKRRGRNERSAKGISKNKNDDKQNNLLFSFGAQEIEGDVSNNIKEEILEEQKRIQDMKRDEKIIRLNNKFMQKIAEEDDDMTKQKRKHKELLEQARREREVELEQKKQQIQQRRAENKEKIQEAKNLLQERNKAKAEEVKEELDKARRRQIRDNFLEKNDKIFSSKKK